MKSNYIFGQYFCGHKISDYGLESHRVDYRTLAKSIDMVLNNEILQFVNNAGYYWEQYNGSDYYYEDSNGTYYTESDRVDRITELEEICDSLENRRDELEEDSKEYSEIEEQIDDIYADLRALDEELYLDIFQYYIISESGAELLRDYTNEIVIYCEKLDMYLWCITHYGTSWDYVLTDIKCNYDEREAE